MIYIEENSSKLPGVEIIDVYLRQYNYGTLASHLLGYIKEIDEEELKSEEYKYNYEGGEQIGTTGVEKTYESILRGRKGKIVYEVDPLGKPVNILEETKPVKGSDLYLTIDIDLQRITEEILYQSILEVRQKKISLTDEYYNVPGGAVEILSPGDGQKWAVTLLMLGKDYPKYCWSKSGHGSLDIVGAIKNSCDIYFYNVGYGLFSKYNNTEELLQKYYRIFGFGSLTGSALPDEDAGLVSDKEWKKDYFKDQKEYSF